MLQNLTVKVHKLVTPAEYAVTKGVTRKTVYNWIERGEVRSRVIAGRKFVELP